MRITILFPLLTMIACTVNPDTSITTEDTLKPDSLNTYWSQVDISSATLFCYTPENNYDEGILIVNDSNKLHSTVLDSMAFQLDAESLRNLRRLIVNVTQFEEEWGAECFEPHHGIIFYDKSEKIVGHISICFECNQYRLSPQNIYYIPMEELKDICVKVGAPITRYEIYKSRKGR